MAYSRRGSYRRPGNNRKIMRCGGQLTTRFRNKITNIVNKTVAWKYQPPADPPTIRGDLPVRKWVRVIPVPAASGLNAAQISVKDSFDYTGGSGARFQSVKPLRARFYKNDGGYLKINISGSNSASGLTTFEDYGNGKNRTAIGVIFPPVQSIQAAGATGIIANWLSDAVPDIVDVYCEFS